MKKHHFDGNFFKLLFAILPICFFANCNSGSEKNESSTDTSSSQGGYQLAWSDEFDGNSVDSTNWVFDIGAGKWGNSEQEYYQPANATVSEGNLIIEGRRENVEKNHYTSSRMKTKGKHEFLYGRIEARIKIPVGQGLWPAFWMLGADIDEVDWPGCGETDIMEHINTDSTLYGTLHWDNNNEHVSEGDSIIFTPSEYHVYAVEWDSSSVRWFLDTTKYHEVDIRNNSNNTEEFHKPFFILLNLAIGGDWPGQKIDNSKLPARMYVDYVRVYKKG